MKATDINSLVAGILAIIGFAIGIGQYGRLEAWARNQAMEAMMWKRGLPYFFAPARKHGHRAAKGAPGGKPGSPRSAARSSP
jgi:hypothetical protein